MRHRIKNHALNDGIGTVYSWLSAAMITIVCGFIVLNVLWLGIDAISWSFLTKEPSSSVIHSDAGGILTPMIGTLLLTIIGILIALPLSLCTAIFLCYYSKKGIFHRLVTMAIDILSGVPTIVIALFSVAIFTLPQLGFLSTRIEVTEGVGKAFGRSFLVCGITMAIMVLPFITKSIIEALKTVPDTYIEGSLSLGASKWHTITKIVCRSARQGIVTGTILGIGRIVGDTAIVWLCLGGTLRMTGLQPWWQPGNWLSTLKNTGCTLTSYIFYASPAGEGNNYEVAFGASFILIIIILILNIATALIGNIGMRGSLQGR